MKFAILAMLLTLTACDRGPSAREIFEMRSQCSALAEAVAKEKSGGVFEYTAHYNASNNRCYAKEMISRSLTNDNNPYVRLIDLQTRATVANCHLPYGSPPLTCTIGDKPASQIEVLSLVNRLTAE